MISNNYPGLYTVARVPCSIQAHQVAPRCSVTIRQCYNVVRIYIYICCVCARGMLLNLRSQIFFFSPKPNLWTPVLFPFCMLCVLSFMHPLHHESQTLFGSKPPAPAPTALPPVPVG